MMLTRIIASFFAACLCVGCTYSGQFTVGVVNKTDQPLSVGLVKNGPPLQPDWASPLDISLSQPNLTQQKWGTLVPPGQAVVIGPQPGEFSKNVVAVLRVYRGDLPVDDLLAISPGSRDRLDIPLDNGSSGFIIEANENGLTAQPTTAPPPHRGNRSTNPKSSNDH
ncbi:MAG: hypothetical protein IT448_07935 [Phycisphaerales bacterium]|nr:hypothetical protein [Phycisphaerales bacterium]